MNTREKKEMALRKLLSHHSGCRKGRERRRRHLSTQLLLFIPFPPLPSRVSVGWKKNVSKLCTSCKKKSRTLWHRIKRERDEFIAGLHCAAIVYSFHCGLHSNKHCSVNEESIERQTDRHHLERPPMEVYHLKRSMETLGNVRLNSEFPEPVMRKSQKNLFYMNV